MLFVIDASCNVDEDVRKHKRADEADEQIEESAGNSLGAWTEQTFGPGQTQRVY